MKFSFKDFFSKCDQIRSFLRIWSYLQKKSLIENFTFCAVWLCKDILETYQSDQLFPRVSYKSYFQK